MRGGREVLRDIGFWCVPGSRGHRSGQQQRTARTDLSRACRFFSPATRVYAALSTWAAVRALGEWPCRRLPGSSTFVALTSRASLLTVFRISFLTGKAEYKFSDQGSS